MGFKAEVLILDAKTGDIKWLQQSDQFLPAVQSRAVLFQMLVY